MEVQYFPVKIVVQTTASMAFFSPTSWSLEKIILVLFSTVNIDIFPDSVGVSLSCYGL